jgi:hypothetical protein
MVNLSVACYQIYINFTYQSEMMLDIPVVPKLSC